MLIVYKSLYSSLLQQKLIKVYICMFRVHVANVRVCSSEMQKAYDASLVAVEQTPKLFLDQLDPCV